jgi:GntR family transcriptional repressor for pyruvate dehydrogenase complex
MSRAINGSATDDAIAKIKELIRSGEFGAGSKLPNERSLAERFGLSRSSLREALRALALVGVVEAKVGNGTFVTTLETDMLLTGIGLVSDLLAGSSLLDMHDVRKILEPEARAGLRRA